MKRKLRILTALLACVCMIAACGENQMDESSDEKTSRDILISQSELEEETTSTKEIFAMDTYMTVTATGVRSEEAVDAALDEIRRLDVLLSVGNEDSEVYAINKNGSGALSKDSAALLEKSLWIYETTNGAYDITVYPLMELWGFTGDDPALPKDGDISEVLKRCGSDKLSVSDNRLTLGSGQGIDFGGTAKGYTSARIMEIFEEYGMSSGVVSLGGNVQCFRTKPDGSQWRCGITDPENPDDTSSLLGIVSTSNKAVITSGAYERFFVDKASGKTYHHIMDPKTGYPAESGLTSVTVVSNDGTLADGLSTACFVMGEKGAVEYWKKYSDQFDLILMTSDGRLIITEGLKDSFTSNLDFEVVSNT